MKGSSLISLVLIVSVPAFAQKPEFARCDKAYEEAQAAKVEIIAPGLALDALENLYLDIEALQNALQKKPSRRSLENIKRCMGVKQKTFKTYLEKVSPKEKSGMRFNMVMGRALKLWENYQEALSYFNRAIEASPGGNDFDALYLAFESWSKWQSERFSGPQAKKLGFEDFEKFRVESDSYIQKLLLHPRSPTALKVRLLMDRVTLAEGIGRGAETLGDYKKIIEFDPKNVKALSRVAKFEKQRGRNKEARAALEQLVSVAPSASGYEQLLALQLEQDDFTQALQSASKARKLFPSNANLEALYASTLAANGRMSEAIKINNAVLKRDPKNKRARDTQSFVLEFQGDASRRQDMPGKALSEYAQALKMTPGNLRLRIKMASMLYDYRYDMKFEPADPSRKDMDEVLRLLDEAVKKSEVDETLLLLHAGAAAHSNQSGAGVVSCDRYRNEFGPLPTAEAIINCAVNYKSGNRVESAREILRKAQSDAKFRGASQELAEALKDLR